MQYITATDLAERPGARELSQVAEELRQSVSRFKIA